MTGAADRNLLLGIIALQMDFISGDALIAAMHAWVLNKAGSISQVLQDRGSLTASRRAPGRAGRGTYQASQRRP